MNPIVLVLAGLVHHWRTHLGVAAGFTLAATVLTGALLVGDSARGSLRERALARIGSADVALVGGERLFRMDLAAELGSELGVQAAPALVAPASASAGGGKRRANGVSVVGVEASFMRLAPQPGLVEAPQPGEALLARSLAARLEVDAGEEVLLRVSRPSALPLDMILAQTDDATLAVRVTVREVIGDEEFARFALSAGPRDPANAFVDLSWLNNQLELDDQGRANLVLLASEDPPGELEARAREALRSAAQLDDLQLALVELEDGTLELSSSRVFLDAPIGAAAARMEGAPTGVLTYFVNALRGESGEVPYSMVTAMGPLSDQRAPGLDDVFPSDLPRDGVVISTWLAEDQGLEVGSDLELDYFVPGPDRRLSEASAKLTVRSVVPMQGLAGDRTLMPAFPGLDDADHCADWDPGVPVDLDEIREADEEYWDEWRGTPKAFISLEAGRELWGSRFGDLTAVRFLPGTAVEEELLARLDPAALGLEVRDLRGPALAGSDTPTDFGGLFLGLSFFLIAAALLLTGLLIAFGVESRAQEVGLYLALGFSSGRVRRLLFTEFLLVTIGGVLLGAWLGGAYTRAVLAGLDSAWSDAVASTPMRYHGQAVTFWIGAAATLAVSAASAWWTLRGQVSRTAVELFAADVGDASSTGRPHGMSGRLVAAGTGLGALVMVVSAPPGSGPDAALAFFGAGALALACTLLVVRGWIRGMDGSTRPPGSLRALAFRNAGRRPGRSLATVALLAWGTFLVVSIGVHRRETTDQDPTVRASGTGGFSFIAEASVPVPFDLAEPEAVDFYALDPAVMEGASFVGLRVRDGDEASCLNLGAPQAPRLVGVRAGELVRRQAFTFAEVEGGDGVESPWELLRPAEPGGAIPVIGDAASVTWSLKLGLGGELEYRDERGEPFRVRIVATLSDSILQGDLLMAEEAFQARFPSASGYRRILVEAPRELADALSEELTAALSTEGVEMVPTLRRLAEFRSVQNAYLDIFQLLGGLGVLLGSLGVSIVALRNALERRGEFAALGAMGFNTRRRSALLFWEHVPLIGLGLGTGAAAALLALLPALRARGAGPALGEAPLLAAATLALALGGVTLTALLSVRGDSLEGLRSE